MTPQTIAVKCDACSGGYVDGRLCGKCYGNETVLVPTPKTPRQKAMRYMAWVVFWAVIFMLGFWLAWGGR